MKDIDEKIAAGQRLNQSDGLRLFGSCDLHWLGSHADAAKRKRHGDNAFYIINRHINYANVCKLACKVCGFGRVPGSQGCYELTNSQIARQAADALAQGACEVHITGALHPNWKLPHYLDMLRRIRKSAPKVHIKAFTAVEIDHIATMSGLTIEATLGQLVEAGLNSMPGGGAEIFDQSIRDQLFPRKITGQRWLDIHRQAHHLAIPTTATMLYGHVETMAQRVDHLLQLRALQDETAGFQAFVPLSYVPMAQMRNDEQDPLIPLQAPGGLDDLRTVAASRLILDNFCHIKTFWVMHSLKLSQVALHFGADDIDGTIGEYKIVDSAQTIRSASSEILRQAIQQSGLKPISRNSLYQSTASRDG